MYTHKTCKIHFVCTNEISKRLKYYRAICGDFFSVLITAGNIGNPGKRKHTLQSICVINSYYTMDFSRYFAQA